MRQKMYKIKNRLKGFTTIFIIWVFLTTSLNVPGQDIVASRDISGGSSVFTFPKSRKARQSKFSSSGSSKTTRQKRTVAQRTTSRKKIRKQYTSLAKVKTRVDKIKVVDPITLPQFQRETPENTAVIFVGVAQYYLNQNNLDEAVNYYKEAVSLDEKNEDAKLGYSDVLVQVGDKYIDDEDYRKAKKEYLEAIQVNPENSSAYAGLGEVYDSTDEDDLAIENYEKALSIDPELTEVNAPLGIIYFQKGEIAKADEILTKALEKEADNAETQYFLGLVRYTQNRNDEALQAFKNAANYDPTNAEPHYYMGEILERLGKDSEAIAEFEKATQLDPGYVDAWFSLGVAYYNSDQFEKSAEAYDKTVKLKNDYAEAYANLGDAYRQMADGITEIKGRYKMLQKASSAYNLAVTFIQNDPKIAADFSEDEIDEIYNKYGYVAGQINILAAQQGIRHTWDKAIDLLTKTTLKNASAIDYTNLGWAYYNASRIELTSNPQKAKETLTNAKTNLEKAISMNPDKIVLSAARLNLGYTLIDLNDFDGAINNLKPVTKDQPEWAFANYALGVAYFKKGSNKEAVDQFEDAIKTDSNYIEAFSGLGNAYLKMNDEKNVKKVIDRLVKIGTRPALVEAKNLQTALSIKGFKKT
jgi:tetratricopeptide (TPR) repeat protein